MSRRPVLIKNSSNCDSNGGPGSSQNLLQTINRVKPFLIRESNTFKQLQNAAMIKRRTNNKEKAVPTLIMKNDLQIKEALFMDAYYRVKKVQKSLM